MQNARASDKQKSVDSPPSPLIGMLLNWNFAFRIRIENTHIYLAFIPSWSVLIRSPTTMNFACDVSFRPFSLFSDNAFVINVVWFSWFFVIYTFSTRTLWCQRPIIHRCFWSFPRLFRLPFFGRCKSRLFNINVTHEACLCFFFKSYLKRRRFIGSITQSSLIGEKNIS